MFQLVRLSPLAEKLSSGLALVNLFDYDPALFRVIAVRAI
jgi:hypothetical protein